MFRGRQNFREKYGTPRPQIPPKIARHLGTGTSRQPRMHRLQRQHRGGVRMNVQERVLTVLDQVLGLGGRAATFTRDTRLLGAVPEFDSMAVVSLIAALEDQFGIAIDDEDIDGDVFSTIGSLVEFVTQRVPA